MPSNKVDGVESYRMSASAASHISMKCSLKVESSGIHLIVTDAASGLQ